MTNEDTKTDDENDGGEENETELLAWLKATLLAYVARVRAEFAKATDEIAPQLYGTLDRLHIPRSALKPLALAAVVLVAALVVPAAPFGGDPAPEPTAEPEGGNTTVSPPADTPDSDSTDDGDDSTSDEGDMATEYRQVVTTGPSSETAPAAPKQVMTSAGSQTMSVETGVVDGEPAIILEDDRTHDGRWVSIDTSWFEQHLGKVPANAYIDHETNGSYAAPIRVQGTSAAFYVEGFSSNTVTFDGELQVTADSATDGDTITYEAPNGGENLSVELTGVENTKPMSTSTRVSGSESFTTTVGGTTAPRDEAVTFTGVETTSSGSSSFGTLSDGGTASVDVGGNQDARDEEVTVTGTESTSSGSSSFGTVANGHSTSVSVGGNI
ncbi:hypothetical protein, partial [Halorubrum sp. F4]|uniref:hypothetical protein n=1 Tax=Halorubrum sp. F4 TaxID=2989715 RepID=UPI002480D745